MWSKTGEKAGGGKAKDSCREWQGSTRVEMTNIKGAVQVRWFTRQSEGVKIEIV